MAVNRIDHAAIYVDDLGRAVEWYVGVLGLDVVDRDRDRAHVTCRGAHADLTLVAGRPGHGPVSFAIGVDSVEDLASLERRLDDHDVRHRRMTDPGRPGTTVVTEFELITGHTMQFAVAGDGRTAGETDFSWDGLSPTPTDIDHINLLGTTAPSVVLGFLTDVLGFKYSGSVEVEGDLAAVWARAASIDHDIAYMQAVRPDDRLHHVAFAMADGNHYVLLADRLAANGHVFEFGPGRHGGGYFGASGFGSNMFAYAFDPFGNRIEFSGDMKTLPDDAKPVVQSGDHMDEIMNVWARNMPESFMTIGS
jgi:catechol 2,3-dioxygenase